MGLGGEKAIFRKKLIKILMRKRKQIPKEKRIKVEEKLRKQKRLTTDEFWQVYDSIRQDGPIAKYSHPEKWSFTDQSPNSTTTG